MIIPNEQTSCKRNMAFAMLYTLSSAVQYIAGTH